MVRRARRPFLTSLQKCSRIGREHRMHQTRAPRLRYVVMHSRHNAEASLLSIGKNNGDSPGAVLVYTLLCFTCSAAASIKR